MMWCLHQCVCGMNWGPWGWINKGGINKPTDPSSAQEAEMIDSDAHFACKLLLL